MRFEEGDRIDQNRRIGDQLAGDPELRQRRAGFDADLKNGLGLDVLARRKCRKVIVGAGRVERHVDEACFDRQIALTCR